MVFCLNEVEAANLLQPHISLSSFLLCLSKNHLDLGKWLWSESHSFFKVKELCLGT